MYVTKMENVMIYASTWKIVAAVNLSLHEEIYERLKNQTKVMLTMCDEDIKTADVNNLFTLYGSCNESVYEFKNVVERMRDTWTSEIIRAKTTLHRRNQNLGQIVSAMDTSTKSDTTFVNVSNRTNELNTELENVNSIKSST